MVLYTVSRRTGRTHRNPVLCFEHGDERYVVASLGSAPRHPQWYLNLVSEPRVHVRFGADLYEADALTVDDAARAALWPELTARYPMFAEYQANTDRQIPLVWLRRVNPG